MAAVTVRAATRAISPSRRGVQTVGAQPLGDGQHHLPVRHRREERRVEPLRPDRQPLGVATRAEVAALAREGEEILVRARITADAGEAVLQHATRQKLVGDLRDDGAPWAILAREAVVVDRRQAMQVI